jgi:succinyl-CoA synthetase beta subunit
MNIHEYQAKQLFQKFGIRTPRGIPAFTVDEAVAAAEQLGGTLWVVKAQIHAGGRGKAGGVKLARTLEQVREHATAILGATLVTHQTGPEGRLVRRLYIEEGCDIDRELYLGVVLDRDTSKVTFMASSEGGVDIEEVAEHSPEKILREAVTPLLGMTSFQARTLALGLGLKGKAVNSAIDFMQKLYKMYIDLDCAIVEINPLVLTKGGEIIALDGKVNFEANALYRHPEVVEMRDLTEEDPAEIEASKYDLAFINLDGNIGCMVNGAGLAMATMDIIKQFGAEPANFLDVGGGASQEKVTAAFRLITSDPRVKGIFVNIFGGIMKCDVIANGIIAASKEIGLTVPVVVRLEGTNVELGKKILSESGLGVIPADDMADGARKIIAAINRA